MVSGEGGGERERKKKKGRGMHESRLRGAGVSLFRPNIPGTSLPRKRGREGGEERRKGGRCRRNSTKKFLPCFFAL